MSATTSEDVQRLQKLVLHNPTVIDCTEHGPGANDLAATNAAGTSSNIQHYSIQCNRLVTHLCIYYLVLVLHCILLLSQSMQMSQQYVIQVCNRGCLFPYTWPTSKHIWQHHASTDQS